MGGQYFKKDGEKNAFIHQERRMGANYLIDTNAVIEFLGDLLPAKGSQWMERIVQNGEHALSAINKIELLGYKGDENELLVVKTFVDKSGFAPFNRRYYL